MEKIINFLKEEKKVISSFLLNFFIFFIIFFLANLEKKYFFLGIKILTFLLIIYLVINYFKYNKILSIKEQNARLIIENNQLNEQIDEERKDIQEYFLLWVHQIKTPITVLNLLIRKEKLDSKKIKEQIFYIEQYTNMAISYIKLRDRNSDMDISVVKLDDIIKKLLKKYSTIFIEKRITLNYNSIENEIISDSKWLFILIEQILSNSLKYTKKGSITIKYNEKENALLIIDTGIGIKEEDMKKIFDLGYSGFNGRVNEKSSGLGLYLVKKISKILDIEVKAKSTLNKGSTFYIYFNSKLTKM